MKTDLYLVGNKIYRTEDKAYEAAIRNVDKLYYAHVIWEELPVAECTGQLSLEVSNGEFTI